MTTRRLAARWMADGLVALAVTVLALSLLLSQPHVAHAATFTVDSTADAADGVPGDGVCDIGGGDCTLRAAVQEANALPGADTITVPGGAYTLEVGALDITSPITIEGAGAATTIIEACDVPQITADCTGTGSADRVFDVSDGSLTVRDVTIRHGRAAGNPLAADAGGGIFTTVPVTVEDSILADNFGEDGGAGISVAGIVINPATVTVLNTTFNGNVTAGGGTILGNGNIGDSSISNSTFTGNEASVGAVLVWAPSDPTNFFEVTNSTFSGNTNTSISPVPAWGVIVVSGSDLTVTNSTIADNTGFGVQAGPSPNPTTVELRNTILAANSEGSCMADSSAGGAASIVDDGGNLSTDATCGFAAGGDPLLGPLADNGGPTQTRALQTGSPAIDAGDDIVCAAPPVSGVDQRGVVRPQGATCDIGAFELEFVPPATLTVDSTGDGADASIGNGICATSGGDCTLRAAVQEANALTGAQTITFSVSGTVILGTALPDITSADGLTIDGSGQAVVVSGDDAVRPFWVAAGGVAELRELTVTAGLGLAVAPLGGAIVNLGTLTLTDVTVSASTTGGGAGGGGVMNTGTLTITGSTISGNVAANGGGITNEGTLTLTGSTVEGNTATGGFGGGILNMGTMAVTDAAIRSNTADDSGGGIYNGENNTLTVTATTINGNTAAFGGGIYVLGSGAPAGTIAITNTTVSGNIGTVEAGGIRMSNPLSLTNSTISGNTAPTGGGIYLEVHTLTIANTIIADSTGEDCVNSAGSPAPVISNGVNLVEDGSCGFSDFANGTDPGLASLAGNGGPTQTHALLAGSPAIDAGDNTTCEAIDQRGEARPTDGDGDGTATCDIGAYEAAASPPPPPPPPPSPPVDDDPPPPPPPPAVVEVGDLEVPVDDLVTTSVNPDETTELETETPNGDLVHITLPSGSLSLPASSPLATFILGLIDSILDLISSLVGSFIGILGGTPLFSFVTQVQGLFFGIPLTDAAGTLAAAPLTVGSAGQARQPALLDTPGTVTLTITPETLDGAAPETVVLVRWTPDGWVEVPAEVAVASDGSVTLVAPLAHTEALMTVIAAPQWGTFATPPSPGPTLTTWNGGGYDRLDTLLDGGDSVWVTVDGRLVGYVQGAPDFVNARFMARFPDGVPAGVPVAVAR